MPNEPEPASVWRCLRSHDPYVAIRLGASAFTSVTLAGLGMLAAWAWATSIGRRYVRDAEMTVALAVASWAWVCTLFLIWGRVRRARPLVRTILLTLGIAIATGLAGAVADEFAQGDEDVVIAAIVLIAVGIVILVWMPAILRLQRGKPVIGADNQVDVHCPSCGYSMIGLCESRCPECGTRFTIDELIRAQGYTPHRAPRSTLKLPELGPPDHDSQRRADG